MPNWRAMTFRLSLTLTLSLSLSHSLTLSLSLSLSLTLSLSLSTTSKPYRSPGGLNGCLRRNFATEQLYEVLFAGGLPARYLMHAVTPVLSHGSPPAGPRSQASRPPVVGARHVMSCVSSYAATPSSFPPPLILPSPMRCAAHLGLCGVLIAPPRYLMICRKEAGKQ